MIVEVYHGSTVCVAAPRLLPITRRLDFGTGFYTTSDFDQARRWALVKQRRTMAEQAVVSRYDISRAWKDARLKVKIFDQADAEWLDFVMTHRMVRRPPADTYDLIRGPVANDTLYETLSLYERDILTRTETLVRLKTHRLADQIVLTTLVALDCLSFVGSEEVPRG